MLLFLFLVIDLYFLITAVIAQVFNPISELLICYTNTEEAKKQKQKCKHIQ